MIKLFHVDAFTDQPFSGNPAAVCVLSEERPASWMQQLASEMNLSETAFLLSREEGYSLRWFTPRVEVDLCGHATLASAHVLWEQGYVKNHERARFFSKSGPLSALMKKDWIELDFPAEPEERAPLPPGLAKALGTEPLYCGRNRLDYLVEIASEELLRDLNPDLAFLAEMDSRGLIVTVQSPAPGYDFLSRYFAPGQGIDEDPVTGSAHCCLGPYWKKKTGRDSFTAYQASRRGGVIRVEVRESRVLIAGKAITLFRGELLV